MNRWFRVETAIRNDPEIFQLAERLGISTVEAIGRCTLVWAAIAEQRPSGNLERVSDQMLEQWAEFRPRGKRKRGAFAEVYRDLFIAEDAAGGRKRRESWCRISSCRWSVPKHSLFGRFDADLPAVKALVWKEQRCW